ncbi:MAG: endonuclease VIII [Balneolaceae bacterium]
MPEGPEIHREADQIRQAIAQKQCIYSFFYHDHLKPFESAVTGQIVQAVDAYGKGLVITFNEDLYFYSHNQLYGKWYIRPAGSYPNTNRQLRAEIQTESNSALLYSASEIDILDRNSLETHPYLTNLGPDVLKSDDIDEIKKQISDPAFERRSLAALLLDQSFLSGIGNYLRSEILFMAGISPGKKLKDLDNREKNNLSESILTITHRAYISGGVTVEDSIVQNCKSNGESRSQYRFYVFAREGKACRICGSNIEKQKMSGRRIYICPKCQLDTF